MSTQNASSEAFNHEERQARRREFEAGVRIQALAHAREHHRFDKDADLDTIIETADGFESYLLHGRVSE